MAEREALLQRGEGGRLGLERRAPCGAGGVAVTARGGQLGLEALRDGGREAGAAGNP